MSDENVKGTPTRENIFYKIKRHSVFVVLTGAILLALLYGVFTIYKAPVRNSPDSFFLHILANITIMQSIKQKRIRSH